MRRLGWAALVLAGAALAVFLWAREPRSAAGALSAAVSATLSATGAPPALAPPRDGPKARRAQPPRTPQGRAPSRAAIRPVPPAVHRTATSTGEPEAPQPQRADRQARPLPLAPRQPSDARGASDQRPADPALAEPPASDDMEEADAMIWSIDRDGIEGAMRESRAALSECYAAWQRADQSLAGRIVVQYTIDIDPDDPERGRITRVTLPENTVAHPLLEGCVLNVVSGLSWAAPDAPLTVNYPLIFSPHDEP